MKEAKNFYFKISGRVDLKGGYIKIVPKKDWANYYILDINETKPDSDEAIYDEEAYCNDYKIIETFADYAARNKMTDIIATTEY